MRVAVIGCGRHAQRNLYPNLVPAGLTPVATCATRLTSARAAADRWGIAHAFDNAREMLSTVEVEGVVICVPPSAYAGLIRLCLEDRLPVYCEKPCARDATEAIELAGRAAESGIAVVAGYMKRFAPAYTRARDIIGSADFGAPTLASFTFVMGPWPSTDVRDYVLDNPVHHLDLARSLLGEIDELNARVVTGSGSRHSVAALATLASGAMCTFTFGTSGSWSQRNEHVEVFGDGHSVSVDNVDTCVHRPPSGPAMLWAPNYTVPRDENMSATIMGFQPALAHFRDVVQLGVPNVSDLASAARTLVLAQQICDQEVR